MLGVTREWEPMGSSVILNLPIVVVVGGESNLG